MECRCWLLLRKKYLLVRIFQTTLPIRVGTWSVIRIPAIIIWTVSILNLPLRYGTRIHGPMTLIPYWMRMNMSLHRWKLSSCRFLKERRRFILCRNSVLLRRRWSMENGLHVQWGVFPVPAVWLICVWPTAHMLIKLVSHLFRMLLRDMICRRMLLSSWVQWPQCRNFTHWIIHVCNMLLMHGLLSKVGLSGWDIMPVVPENILFMRIRPMSMHGCTMQ